MLCHISPIYIKKIGIKKESMMQLRVLCFKMILKIEKRLKAPPQS